MKCYSKEDVFPCGRTPPKSQFRSAPNPFVSLRGSRSVAGDFGGETIPLLLEQAISIRQHEGETQDALFLINHSVCFSFRATKVEVVYKPKNQKLLKSKILTISNFSLAYIRLHLFLSGERKNGVIKKK